MHQANPLSEWGHVEERLLRQEQHRAAFVGSTRVLRQCAQRPGPVRLYTVLWAELEQAMAWEGWPGMGRYG